jgi:hypothetical protein
MLPGSLVKPLQVHLQRVKQMHQHDLEQGYGSVYLRKPQKPSHPALIHTLHKVSEGTKSEFKSFTFMS